MDPFEGTWNIRRCAGPSDIEALLEGAKVTVAKDVATWTLKEVTVPASMTTLVGGKLQGELSFEGKSYYFEIVVCTPPLGLTAPKPCIYGIFSQIHQNKGGGDLGDPGTWKAEESGTNPLG